MGSTTIGYDARCPKILFTSSSPRNPTYALSFEVREKPLLQAKEHLKLVLEEDEKRLSVKIKLNTSLWSCV